MLSTSDISVSIFKHSINLNVISASELTYIFHTVCMYNHLEKLICSAKQFLVFSLILFRQNDAEF